MVYVFKQEEAFPKDGRRLSFADKGFRSILDATTADSASWPARNGYNTDQWMGVGASPTQEVRRNVMDTFLAEAGSTAVAADAPWVAPTGHTPGFYEVEFRRTTPVNWYERSQGHGSYIVTRTGTGYPAVPATSYGVTMGSGGVVPLISDDDPHLAMYLGQGLPRMAWKTGELAKVPGQLTTWGGQHQSAWNDWVDSDPARPMRASCLTHADVTLNDIQNNPSMVLSTPTDSRVGFVRYLVPGNELSDNGVNEGGNLGPSLVTGGFMGAYKSLMATAGLANKVAAPTNCILAPFALDAQRQFFVAAKAAGITFAARPIHAYNAELGDLRRGRFAWNNLMVDHLDPALGLATTPIIHEEAGTFIADEFGCHSPIRQAWMVMLQIMLGEVYAGVHGLFSKEMRIEFHTAPGGFTDFPSWWESVQGPYAVVCWTLTDSQEKFGCSQTVEAEFVTDDPNRLIGAIHRRADGTGVLQVMSTRREAFIRVRIPEAANQTRLAVNAWGVEKTISFDSTGLGLLPAGGRLNLPNDPHARCPVYLRLGAGEVPQYVSDAPQYGYRVPYGSVTLVPENFSTEVPRLIGPVRNRDDLRDELALLNGSNIIADTTSAYVSEEAIEELPEGEFRMRVEFPTMRFQKLAIEQLAIWHHAGAITHMILEWWDGASWQPLVELDDRANVSAKPWRSIGHYLSVWDDNTGFDLVSLPGVVTDKVRLRVLDLTPGSAPSAAALHSLGRTEPATTNQVYKGVTQPIVDVDANYHPLAMTSTVIPSGLAAMAAGIESTKRLWLRSIEVHGQTVSGGWPESVTLPAGWTANPTGLYTFGG